MYRNTCDHELVPVTSNAEKILEFLDVVRCCLQGVKVRPKSFKIRTMQNGRGRVGGEIDGEHGRHDWRPLKPAHMGTTPMKWLHVEADSQRPLTTRITKLRHHWSRIDQASRISPMGPF